jgi:FMN phosphatase YigB (HAD superfamily)
MIRLVIFDFGDTLFHAEADPRSVGTGKWEVLERDGAGWPTAVAPPDRKGFVEKAFPHVQEVLRELRRRGIWLSVASSADPDYTPFMIEAFGMGALFRHAFMTQKGDYQQDCRRKGDWVEAIIHAYNIGECQDDPLKPHEVLFVDDLARCLSAVQKKVPGINVVLSVPRMGEGLRYIYEVIEEINADST